MSSKAWKEQTAYNNFQLSETINFKITFTIIVKITPTIRADTDTWGMNADRHNRVAKKQQSDYSTNFVQEQT